MVPLLQLGYRAWPGPVVHYINLRGVWPHLPTTGPNEVLSGDKVEKKGLEKEEVKMKEGIFP